MSILPAFQAPLTMSLIAFVAVARPFVEPGRRRMWILSSLTTTIVSIVGTGQLIYWSITGDAGPSATTDFMLELMKTYLLVDLAHNAVYHFRDMPILDCWVHHIAYIYIFDRLISDNWSGAMRPFLILEVPAAVRALGSLFPSVRNDMAYGALFFLLRVVWPFIAVCSVRLPGWGIGCFVVAQSLHVFWFYKWIRRLLRVRADIDRTAIIDAVAEEGDAPDVRRTATCAVAECDGTEITEDQTQDEARQNRHQCLAARGVAENGRGDKHDE